MLDGQLSVQLSSSSYHYGWHPSPKYFPEHFCFFLGSVRLLDTLIAVPQHGVYLEASVEKSLLMVRASFSLLQLFSQAARATRRCFAVSRAVVTGVSLSILSHSWFLVAFPLAISLSLLTSDLNRLIFLSALQGDWGRDPFCPTLSCNALTVA